MFIKRGKQEIREEQKNRQVTVVNKKLQINNNSHARQLSKEKKKSGHYIIPIQSIFIVYTLYTRSMYALVKCQVTAVLLRATLSGSGRNMASSLRAGQSARFEGFLKKVKMIITQKLSH